MEVIGNEFCDYESYDGDLIKALQKHDVILACRLLLQVNNIDFQDEDGNTSLHLASRHGLTIIARQILSLNPDLNVKDKNGCTPLCVSIKTKHLDIAYELITKGADLNIQDKDGYTALHYASFGGYAQTVKELMNFHAKLDVKDRKKNTPLCVAIKNNHFDIAQQLMQHGADVNSKAEYGYTALLYVMNDDSPWKREPQSPTKVYDSNKLFRFAKRKNEIYEITDQLLQHGANVNIQNFTGFTALHYAASLGQEDIAQRLLQERRTDVDIVDDCEQTPLHIAVRHGHIGIVQKLLAAGADVNFSATEHGRPFCCDPFISTGIATRFCWAQTDMSNRRTPLHIAVKNEYFDIARLLVGSGADVDRLDEDGATALIVAANVGNIEIVKFLVQSKACLNIRQRYGQSALHLVLELQPARTLHLAKFLIIAGADVNMKIGRKTLYLRCSELLEINDFMEIMNLSFKCGYRISRDVKDSETSQHAESSSIYVKWLQEKSRTVRSLKDMSRLGIRRTLLACNGGRDITETIRPLPLPRTLQQFLQFK